MEEWMLRFESRFLGREAEYALFLPKGEGPFKTLYLLHGYGGDARQWKEKSALARLAGAYRLAVVMPSCGDGYYQDDPAAGVYTARFLAEELLPESRRLFPLSPRRGDTFLGGVSMGGFGALLVGSRYGGLFGGLACFSSAFVVQELQQARLGLPSILQTADLGYFQRVMGDLAALPGSERDPLAQAKAALKKGSLPPVWLSCGWQDILWPANLEMYQTLEALGADVCWKDGPGGHEWAFFDPCLEEAIPWLLKKGEEAL